MTRYEAAVHLTAALIQAIAHAHESTGSLVVFRMGGMQRFTVDDCALEGLRLAIKLEELAVTNDAAQEIQLKGEVSNYPAPAAPAPNKL